MIYKIIDENSNKSKDTYIDEIVSILKRHDGVCNNMAVINEELKEWNPNFSAKKFGYSKLSSFLQSFDGAFEIDADQNSVRLI